MNFVQDDFFYYLKVASNVASGNGSTFNGIVPTNGYHPLWMWTLAGMIRIGHGIRFVPIFLGASIWLATMASYFLANSLLKKVMSNRWLLRHWLFTRPSMRCTYSIMAWK